jgi:urease accessory protein UreF
MMPWAKPELAQDAAEWLGDAHPLIAQLGSADGLMGLHPLSSALALEPVGCLASLEQFLLRYHAEILLPCELPAICHAYHLAARNHVRELVELDAQLADAIPLRDIASASRRVGRSQLQRLRPLRDERVVQRYLASVDKGEAQGWNTLVYGMTLVVYSLPLRQGLLGYAQQTTRGFIHAGAKSFMTTETECRALFEKLCGPLAAAVESLVLAKS